MKPLMTVAEALAKAEWIARQPKEYMVAPSTMKEVVAVLSGALQSSKCYLKSVRDGIPSFTLLAYDKAAHVGLHGWIVSAQAHGCRPEKTSEAIATLSAWQCRPDLRWPD